MKAIIRKFVSGSVVSPDMDDLPKLSRFYMPLKRLDTVRGIVNEHVEKTPYRKSGRAAKDCAAVVSVNELMLILELLELVADDIRKAK